MFKKITIFILTIILVFSLTSCGEKYANVLFDDLGWSTETLNDWYMEIEYISETRGTEDKIFTTIKNNSSNPTELIKVNDIFYGASKRTAPDAFVFSAEGMSDYIFNFYKKDVEEPVLSFYYYKSENLLTRAIHRFDEKKQVEYIDYEFYTPYGDLGKVAEGYRKQAKEPENKKVGLSLNPAQLKASVEPEELEESLGFDGCIEDIEFYHGELPEDKGTACKMYDSEDIPTLEDDEVILVAKKASTTGEPMDLIISTVEYNSNYTIVHVTEPNEELQQELGVETDNAILLKKTDIDPAKYIVFVDEDKNVVYVVFTNMT
jgi:hypothetical protein